MPVSIQGRQRLRAVPDTGTIYLEFLGLKAQDVVTETDLEDALIRHLQKFLLEFGKGMCFEARQKRIVIDDDYYFPDLVFYNRIGKYTGFVTGIHSSATAGIYWAATLGIISALYALFNVAVEVAHRIRLDDFRAGGVSVFVKTKDFEVHSRQCSLRQPTDVTAQILNEARGMIPTIWDRVTPLRQMGLGVFKLPHDFTEQLTLFDEDAKMDY